MAWRVLCGAGRVGGWGWVRGGGGGAYILQHLTIVMSQLLVSCGGGRRPADGLRKQHVRTIRLLLWDTLEDFSPLGLHTWDEDSTLHARTWTKDESV